MKHSSLFCQSGNDRMKKVYNTDSLLARVRFTSVLWLMIIIGRRDTQHNNIQYNNTQYKNIQHNNTQYNTQYSTQYIITRRVVTTESGF